jgi:hypothetical protein
MTREGGDRRREKVGGEADDEIVLPEKIEGDESRGDISRELPGVNLMEEDFFLQGHG